MKIAIVLLCVFVAALAAGSVAAQDPSARHITISATPAAVRINESTRSTILRLWNLDITPRPIGHAYIICHLIGKGDVLGGGVHHCDASYHLPLGKIVATGVRHEIRHYSLTITGGTRAYLGASGAVHRREARPGVARLIFVLG